MPPFLAQTLNWHTPSVLLFCENCYVLSILYIKQNMKPFIYMSLFVRGPCSTISTESNVRSYGHVFDPKPIPYFHGD